MTATAPEGPAWLKKMPPSPFLLEFKKQLLARLEGSSWPSLG